VSRAILPGLRGHLLTEKLLPKNEWHKSLMAFGSNLIRTKKQIIRVRGPQAAARTTIGFPARSPGDIDLRILPDTGVAPTRDVEAQTLEEAQIPNPMLRRIAAPSFLLLTAATCSAVTPQDGGGPAFTSVPELSAGFHSLYAQNFSGARKQFDDWEAQHPEEPFGEVAVAASYLFEELFREGVLSSDFFLNEKRFLNGIEGKPDAERMKSFEEAISLARRLAKKRLRKDAREPEALFALTLAAGMESNAAMMLRKQHIESLKRLKEANEYAKQLLAEQPDADDAYVALGSANYIIGSLSGGARFMLWFGGIHGDKKLGMEQLKKTIDNGRYLQPFAKILLALAARRERQNTVAQRLLGELSEEYPESPLFATEYAKAMAAASSVVGKNRKACTTAGP
jgi:tetratricopeptide (TPR) repeat protein